MNDKIEQTSLKPPATTGRTKIVTFTISPEVKAYLVAEAKRSGMNQSAFLESIILTYRANRESAAQKSFDSPDDYLDAFLLPETVPSQTL